MDLFETVENRHSIRRYEDRDIEQEKLAKILDAINAAPSAGDLQGYEVVLVKDSATKQALAAASFGQKYVAEAPVVLVFCADCLLSGSKYGKRGTDLYAVQDATIATAYAQLAATAQGLATVWVGAFETAAVSKAIGAPEQVIPVAIIPIGYPAEEPSRTPRRALDDLVRMEKF